MPAKTYDPDQTNLSIGGVPISGFGDSTFITLSKTDDTFTHKQGVDGEVCRVKRGSRLWVATFVLLQSSDSNDYLSALHVADERAPNGAGVVPFQVADLSGRTLFVAAESWITKPPDITFGAEVQDRSWAMAVIDPEYLIGGN